MYLFNMSKLCSTKLSLRKVQIPIPIFTEESEAFVKSEE